MPGTTSIRELAAGETRAQRLYREDGYGWAIEQADALRRRDVGAIDWENVSEEIEAVGKSEKREWTSYCRRIARTASRTSLAATPTTRMPSRGTMSGRRR